MNVLNHCLCLPSVCTQGEAVYLPVCTTTVFIAHPLQYDSCEKQLPFWKGVLSIYIFIFLTTYANNE